MRAPAYKIQFWPWGTWPYGSTSLGLPGFAARRIVARRALAGIDGHNNHRRSPAGHSHATTCHKADVQVLGIA